MNKVSLNSFKTVSTVTFEFDGMMALFMGSSERVSVGLLNAHHHTPEMTIYKLIENEKREIAKFSAEQLNRTINVSVVGGNRKPSQYLSIEGREHDKRDFRWVFDIEKELYGRKLKIKENAFFGKIHFNSGIFYAGSFSEGKVKFLNPQGKILPLEREIAKPESRLDLTDGQQLVIEGLEKVIKLPSGSNYLVSIHNLPPKEMMNIEHFSFYYGIIDEVLPKYSTFVIQTTAFERYTLCPPVSFGMSRIDGSN